MTSVSNDVSRKDIRRLQMLSISVWYGRDRDQRRNNSDQKNPDPKRI